MTSESESLQSFMLPGGGFGYTGVAVQEIQTNELTIATGLLDESGSTHRFAKEMEKCIQTVVRSMRHSPRADNLSYRHCHFGTSFREHHGYKLLQDINEADYDGCYQSGGCTCLYDSLDNVFRASKDYGEQLMRGKRFANGIVYVLTDGCDNGSTLTMNDARDALAEVVSAECLESILTILIGVNDDTGIQQRLKDMAKAVGFTQYIPMKDATESQLAKLADFISHSISSQSQALGTGGPSQALDPGSQGVNTNDSLCF